MHFSRLKIPVEALQPSYHNFLQNFQMARLNDFAMFIYQLFYNVSCIWYLHNVVETYFNGKQLSRQARELQLWPVDIQPGLLGNNNDRANPADMNLLKLHWYTQYLKKNNLKN